MTDIIRDLPEDERPRERLLAHGPETLSDAELLAILLGSGVRGKNAIQLARDLLYQGMPALRRRDLRQLAAIPGIGPAKAARIAAAIEFSRRIANGQTKGSPDYDRTALGRDLVTRCARYRQERFGAALLDARYRILKDREIFVGTINQTLASTRDILRFALLEEACALVMYHNHPSGDPTPSKEDQSFTIRLRDSLRLADMHLVDHLVIGAHGYVSMQESGMI
jgi:DNA repair protein RadC